MPYVIHITLTSNPFFNLYVKMKSMFLRFNFLSHWGKVFYGYPHFTVILP
jgi:hypothetical protein